MATRYKPKTGKLEDLDQVNATLKEIGLCERLVEQIDAEAQKEINEIKVRAADRGEKARARILELSAQISAYSEYNRSELFKDKKSIVLSFGVFGFRKSTKIRVKKSTVNLLKAMGLIDCVRTKEEANKEAMAALTDETLLAVDAVRKVKDDFFCEPNREEINKDLLAAGI